MPIAENYKTSLEIVGSTEFIEIAGLKDIPAKIDTGADTSAVWASSVDMKEDGTLVFVLFDKRSPFYTGEQIASTNYAVKTVRSSHGDEQIRYRVKLPIVLGGKKLETTFTLANRSRNNFPVLIGRHTLEGNFIVDVSKSALPHLSNHKTPHLNRKLKEDPYAFHQKYLKNKPKKGEL